jgi:4-carboxymuconolactone decarboxylase
VTMNADRDDRYARGEAMYRAVYGRDDVPARGTSRYVDSMIEQLFGEVWAADILSIRDRRLLVMGVLAAQGCMDRVDMQLRRAHALGELDAEQIDEAVLHLAHYVGWAMASPLATTAAELRVDERQSE